LTHDTDNNSCGNGDDSSGSCLPSRTPPLSDDATNYSFSLRNNGHSNVTYDPGGRLRWLDA
jgi:hypothetical protein